MLKVLLRIIPLLMLVLWLGCAGTQKKKSEPAPPAQKATMDESFDPLSLNDEDISFPREPLPAPRRQLPKQSAGSTTQPPVIENKKIDGFRVQIFSTKDLERATRARAIAEEQFRDLGLHCYLEFDSPYYKVRIGDFKTREEAEKYRAEIRSRGYPRAWIVKTQIFSNPEFEVPADSAAVGTQQN